MAYDEIELHWVGEDAKSAWQARLDDLSKALKKYGDKIDDELSTALYNIVTKRKEYTLLVTFSEPGVTTRRSKIIWDLGFVTRAQGDYNTLLCEARHPEPLINLLKKKYVTRLNALTMRDATIIEHGGFYRTGSE